MNYKKIVLTFFFTFQTVATPFSNDSTLMSVVIMVKNEAPVIEKTLQPFIDAGIENFLVFDTGSTDGTQDIARNLFKKHNLFQAYVIEEPFVDFEISRNRAIEHTEKLFPQTAFILMIDAEWYISGAKELISFCKQEIHSATNSYFLNIRLSTAYSTKKNFSNYKQARLFKPFKGIKFIGAVHEVLNEITTVSIPKECFFEFNISEYGQQKSAERWKRDKVILLNHLEKNPGDCRTLFYLGQTCDCLGQWQEAYDFYKKRAALPGWDEENFVTELRLGNIAQHLPSKEHDASCLCSPAIQHYLQAYTIRPHRAEPLVKIAQYYLKKNIMSLAFLFSLHASKIAYPVNDILFVEDELYNITRYDVLSVSAWYMGEYETGEWATRQALTHDPDNTRLQKNLTFYTQGFSQFIKNPLFEKHLPRSVIDELQKKISGPTLS